MALKVLDVVGDRVYIGGYVDLSQVDPNTVQVNGLEVDGQGLGTYQIAAQEAEVQAHPGFGAGKILRFICEKIKDALCNNCN